MKNLTHSSTDRRFDADYVTLSKLVNNGSLGRISEFETHFDRHRPQEPSADAHKWKNKVIPGGSGIYDLGTHLLDQVVHLLGLPKRVTAFIGSARAVNTSGFEDSFTVLLHYANGTLVTAKATVISPEEEQLRFWVRGENGSFKKVRAPSRQRKGYCSNGDPVPPRYPRRPAQGWYHAPRQRLRPGAQRALWFVNLHCLCRTLLLTLFLS